jgi:hypothetical protein
MGLNTVPRFIEQHIVGMEQVSTANVNRDGTGTMATIVTSDDPDGILISLVRFQAIVTTTAGMIRLFLHDGSDTRLLVELPVAAVTVSGSVEGDSGEWVPSKDLVLPENWELRASTENAEAINVFAFGGRY